MRVPATFTTAAVALRRWRRMGAWYGKMTFQVLSMGQRLRIAGPK
jgi:hypothetical protein